MPAFSLDNLQCSVLQKHFLICTAALVSFAQIMVAGFIYVMPTSVFKLDEKLTGR